MDHTHPPYTSYVLRLWPARCGANVVWRASLEEPGTGERLGFADLERLFAFLRDQTRDAAAQLTAPVDTNKS